MITGYHVALETSRQKQMQTYLENWFFQTDEVVGKSGVSVSFIDALVEAQACPGIVYSTDAQGRVWSALSAYLDHPNGGGICG